MIVLNKQSCFTLCYVDIFYYFRSSWTWPCSVGQLGLFKKNLQGPGVFAQNCWKKYPAQKKISCTHMLWEKISLRMKGFLFFIFLAPKYVHNQFPCKETLLFWMPFCTTLYTCNKLPPAVCAWLECGFTANLTKVSN